MHAEFTLLSDQPIPSGCAVSTVYGEGVVTGYRSSDSSFIVSLPFGATAYLNRKAILCTVLPVDTFEENAWKAFMLPLHQRCLCYIVMLLQYNYYCKMIEFIFTLQHHNQ